MNALHHTLIPVAELQARLAAGAPTVVLDARFDLSEPEAGRAAYVHDEAVGLLGGCLRHSTDN